jgi:hypothetical protein
MLISKYYRLNNLIVKDNTPLLEIKLILRRLLRAYRFIKLNIYNAYYCVHIRENNK